MNFQKFVDGFSTCTCVISVEKKSDGSYGKIRIVTGNKAYIESIEGKSDAPALLTNKFIPNSEYQTYFPQDLNFEEFCYRSAVLKQPLHTYVHPDRFDFWFNLFFFPIECDDDKLAYCTYTQELTHKPNAKEMSKISYETASDVLTTCIKLRGTDDFAKSIKEVICDIRNICKSSYCCIMLMNHTDQTCSLLCESFSQTATFDQSKKWMDSKFYEMASTWEEIIGGSNCLIIKNPNDWNYVKKHNQVWHDSLINFGVESMVLFPLKSGKNLLGYIWATNFETKDTIRIKETLELTTYFLASEISNYQLFNKFRILSTIDSLTGVYNRNEMNNRVDYLCSNHKKTTKSLGIVFVDLNGLKKTNDLEGHLAGDSLLKEAASILREIFPKDEIYRAGGDEFMVLCLNTTKEEQKQKIKALKSKVKDNNSVSFAIGACFDEDSKNILSVMSKADKKMYNNKKEYYKIHPDKKRRF